MTLKVLLIEDDAEFRKLITQHLATGLEAVQVTEHEPLKVGPLVAEFNAVGYDAVLLDAAPGGGSGLQWLNELRLRPLFPPVIYLLGARDDAAAAAALAAGAYGCIAKHKIGHRQFVTLVMDAAGLQKRAVAAFRGSSAAATVYRFGETTIKGLRCIRALATSTMSTVYLAESEREARLVVLKLLRQIPDLDNKPGTFDRFLQEYEIIRQIDHPNVVKIYELGVSDDHAYIQMEYFSAGDLRAQMRRGIKPLEALEFLRQMAAALAAIHDAGVLHRDLKPGNVMLRADGSIALIDFGLAKQLSLEAEITATGEIFGTPYYMSPEQGHGKPTDARSDLYSLGVIFYEMLTGKKPYLAPTPMAVIYKHSHTPIPLLPPEFAHWQLLLERMLAKAPRDRCQSGRDLVAAIDALPPAPAVAPPGDGAATPPP
jgi:tRNA A-37 threonylcarbamoyl transferase component Bud32/ActR/RegA family two-component response regulator